VMHKQFFTCALLLLVRRNLTSKSDAQAIFHMCITFAGSSKFNQQKWCTCIFAWDCKLVIIELGRTIFALVWLTVQWSCRSMLMLWWSDSSANTVVLMQCIAVWTCYMYVLEWKLFEAASSTFMIIVYVCLHDKRIFISHRIKHHKWQWSECGWKCFNICTNNFDTHLVDWLFVVDQLMFVWAWMLVNELFKEQECIYSNDVGWFCFVSMKQRKHILSLNIYTFVCILMVMLSTLVIMKWFHLTLLWKIRDVYDYCSSISIHSRHR